MVRGREGRMYGCIDSDGEYDDLFSRSEDKEFLISLKFDANYFSEWCNYARQFHLPVCAVLKCVRVH